ncbi:hypothetical protein [Methanocella sp. MCL-LM]|uniref:hypothetical protein n=1 Tax=Methanocella sp. MCL-LM TaxID=3412035 RepID=UPI003C71B416
MIPELAALTILTVGAAYDQWNHRHVPNWIWLLGSLIIGVLVAAGYIYLSLWSVTCVIFCGIILIVMFNVAGDRIGGADIKAGLLLIVVNPLAGIAAFAVGVVLADAYMRRKKVDSVALLPFIWVGYVAVISLLLIVCEIF